MMTIRAAVLPFVALATLLGGCMAEEKAAPTGSATPVAERVETSPAPSATVSEVVSTGMPITPSPTAGENGYSETERAKCLAQKGTYERRGMMGLYSCAIPYADAGKTCRKAGDCLGQCRTIPGSDVKAPVGKCQATNDNFGCYAYLGPKGEVLGICVD